MGSRRFCLTSHLRLVGCPGREHLTTTLSGAHSEEPVVRGVCKFLLFALRVSFPRPRPLHLWSLSVSLPISEIPRPRTVLPRPRPLLSRLGDVLNLLVEPGTEVKVQSKDLESERGRRYLLDRDRHVIDSCRRLIRRDLVENKKVRKN